MKTTEENKSEVLNYLNKSSKHLFTINGVEHKVLVEGNFYIRITGKEISIGDIDKMISYYGSNAKCVIKHELFLNPRYYNKDIKSIPNYKFARKKFSEISEAIKGKEDRDEIKKIILDILNK
jgi:hypothetical protein